MGRSRDEGRNRPCCPIYPANGILEKQSLRGGGRELPPEDWPEHFMEATAQATQRKITVGSFELVHARRPDVQAFNELLVMYPVGPQKKNWKVVPDNMVVVHPEPIEAAGHFTPPAPAGRAVLGAGVRQQGAASGRTTSRQHAEVRAPTEGAVLPALLPRQSGTDPLPAQRPAVTPRCSPTRTGCTRSRNWRWPSAWSRAGRGSGSAARCCRCPATSSTTSTRTPTTGRLRPRETQGHRPGRREVRRPSVIECHRG